MGHLQAWRGGVRSQSCQHRSGLSSKYSWTAQSKLNDYRGYAWMALRDFDPGTVTQTTEGLNTSFNPSLMKWLKPSFNYSANYRWNDDLSREGQNISTQLRFGSNFSLTPVQLFEFIYKPPSKSGAARKTTRSRSRNRDQNSSKDNKPSKQKKDIKALTFLYNIFGKINPISLSYTETLNRTGNQIIGAVPVGYKFGWVPEHGLKHSDEVGTNKGNWDHKRDGSIRSGLKLTRSISINLNYSQNLSTNRSASGLEQISVQRDYLAYGKYLDQGSPLPGWSFRISGLEKLPIINWLAKNASLEHSYSGKENRSWQFESIKARKIDLLNFDGFIEEYKENERSARISRNFSPLIGINMTLKKNISVTFRHNRNKTLDETPAGITLREDNSYTSTGTYSHRGGITLPIPYYGDVKLNNTMSFTMNFDLNDSREFRSGDKIAFEEGIFTESWKAGLRVSYQFNTRVSGGLRYEYRESDSRTAGKKIDRDFGFDVNLSISG